MLESSFDQTVMAASIQHAMLLSHSHLTLNTCRRTFNKFTNNPYHSYSRAIRNCRKLIQNRVTRPSQAKISNALNLRSFSQATDDSDSNNCPRGLVPWQKKEFTNILPPAYNPEYVEAIWYKWWEQKGFHQPQPIQDAVKKRRFVICLPPPNVTGSLHLGHALTCSIQDAIVRWYRMQGHQVLWVPGLDHAGIATQVIIEKWLWKKKGCTKHDIGREKFLEEVWKWKIEKENTIYEQMKRLGASLDWTRHFFTMDQNLSKAINEAFIRLHDEGLIYRKKCLVNWSCVLKSAISDVEIEMLQLKGKTKLEIPGYAKKVQFGTLTSFAYPVVGTDEKIIVATTRPETIFGDVAVAVHPEDSRYQHLHGALLQHPFSDRKIPVIADEFVDKEFGEGAVKLTPCHDQTDYEVCERHGLPISFSIIDDSGLMCNVGAPFEGMKRFDARKAVVKSLKQKDLYHGTINHSMMLPVCSRSKDVIEPLLMDQWFLNCKTMATKATQAVTNNLLCFIPDYYDSIWFHWLQNIRDWCISRQLWWGHQIPAYFATTTPSPQLSTSSSTGIWVSARNQEEALAKASEKLSVPKEQITLKQDEDVLDTWFSSALLPFSVFGWPEKTIDYESFYPTDLLETGSDILFFWVARMVMLGQKLTGQLPFDKILLHGIIRDSEGRKMSKSQGNVIDPLNVIYGASLKDLQNQLDSSVLDQKEIEHCKKEQHKNFPHGIPQCGADALRFTLCSYNFKLQTINIQMDHIKSSKFFCNKIWQASRFIHLNQEDSFTPKRPFALSGHESAIDKWILSVLTETTHYCDPKFRNYDLQLVTNSLRKFWIQNFCDIYLESVKPILKNGSEEEKETVNQVLHFCLETYLKAISPFMPYLSEELYQQLMQRSGHFDVSVCSAAYPNPKDFTWRNPFIEEDMNIVQDLCSQALFLRKEFSLTKAKGNVFISSSNEILLDRLSQNYSVPISTLSRSASVNFIYGILNIPHGCVSSKTVADTCQVHLSLQGLVDPVIELNKLTKKVEKVLKELEKIAASMNRDLRNNELVDEKKIKAVENLNSELDRLQNYVSVLEKLEP
ncbi:valine--tRNA ligase [Octopus bimaculoides]|nr:valine--tRNA ligase [Octopus bimaculoides]|eukprot:XP_014784317.1 PREDICTED: valine--tRNA ligase-like isoform X2 [Octopus bimaculoides]